MRVITIQLPQGIIEAIDVMVGVEEFYASRSEFIRRAIDFFMIIQLIRDKKLDLLCKEILKEPEIEPEKVKGRVL